MIQHGLEAAAQAVADAAATRPTLEELGVAEARRMLKDLQAGCVDGLDVEEKWIVVSCDWGDVRVRLVRPSGDTGALPVVLYIHGGGWVLGDAGTHDRLVRELALGAHAAVAFVDYDRSPEAQYPVAIEQSYATALWITRDGAVENLDGSRLAVAGDSAGGNMAAALAIMAQQRGDVRFVHQSLYYPITDSMQTTDSYREFADGPYLTAKIMTWFWNCYLPEVAIRAEITASPLRASITELSALPEALVIVSENDVLRDEGEEYARRLSAAGVRTTSVRINGTIHDFMMLNSLHETAAATAAMDLAIHELRKVLQL